MRATVFFAPNFFANVQATMLRVSNGVTAIKRSQLLTLAFFKVLNAVGLPVSVIKL